MENQKQRKSAGTVVLVVLLLIVTIAALILATYAWARYTTVEHNTASAQVAKWDVSFKTANDRITKTTYSHVVDGKLAPGTEGQFVVEVNSNQTEVSYDFGIRMKELKNKPTNLHFYATKNSDGTYADEITFYDNSTISDYTNVTSPLYGHVGLTGTTPNQAAVANSKQTRTIYWQWKYQTPTIYVNKAGTETLPEDIDTQVTYTDTSSTATPKATITQTKRERIVHDIKEFMRSKGIADDAYTLSNKPTLQEMQALGIGETGAKTYTISKPVIDAVPAGETSIPANGTTETVTVSKAEIDQVINDAIDTVDGLAARTMSFEVECTAIQCDPTSGETTEFTSHIKAQP